MEDYLKVFEILKKKPQESFYLRFEQGVSASTTEILESYGIRVDKKCHSLVRCSFKEEMSPDKIEETLLKIQDLEPSIMARH